MKHRKFSVEDIIQDKSFRDWVLSDDSESAEYWNRWLSEHPDQLPMIQEAREMVRKISFREYSLDSGEKTKLWKQIEQKTGESTPKQVAVRYLHVDRIRAARRRKTGNWKVAVAAVAALLLATIGIGLYMQLIQSTGEQVTYRTDFGETREIYLEDGTGVVLNANTKLQLIPGWDRQDERKVWVEGEAFFEVVTEEDSKPFVVHTPDIDARVLGTSFNVYNRNSKTRFELASGKLELANRLTRTAVEMNPGDQVVYEDAAVDPVRRRIETNEVAPWRDNLLIFRRTPLEEIGEMLTSNYGLTVIFEDEDTAHQYFTGTVPSDDIDHLLATLSRTFDLQIERRDGIVIIQTGRDDE